MCQGLLPSRRHIEKREDPGDEVVDHPNKEYHVTSPLPYLVKLLTQPVVTQSQILRRNHAVDAFRTSIIIMVCSGQLKCAEMTVR